MRGIRGKERGERLGIPGATSSSHSFPHPLSSKFAHRVELVERSAPLWAFCGPPWRVVASRSGWWRSKRRPLSSWPHSVRGTAPFGPRWPRTDGTIHYEIAFCYCTPRHEATTLHERPRAAMGNEVTIYSIKLLFHVAEAPQALSKRAAVFRVRTCRRRSCATGMLARAHMKTLVRSQ